MFVKIKRQTQLRKTTIKDDRSNTLCATGVRWSGVRRPVRENRAIVDERRAPAEGTTSPFLAWSSFVGWLGTPRARVMDTQSAASLRLRPNRGTDRAQNPGPRSARFEEQ